MKHVLKIESAFYQAIVDGRKTFEIRYNDRGFNAGDSITLEEITESGLRTIRQLSAEIGYVTAFHQKENWVVFSLLNIEVNP